LVEAQQKQQKTTETANLDTIFAKFKKHEANVVDLNKKIEESMRKNELI